MEISPITAVIAVTAIISFIGFQNRALFERYMFNVGAVKRGDFIRLISSGFLHADWMHLIFNMLTLYFFAPIVLEVFGSITFLLIYFGSVLAGNLFSLLVYKDQGHYSAIGASGGVSGILFASIALYPHIGIYIMFIPIPVPGYIFGLLYFAYSAYMMLNPRQYDNIGHSAHLGGAAVGLLCAIILAPKLAMQNILQLLVMALPLFYIAYMIFVKRRK